MRWCKTLFFLVIVRPFVGLVLGKNIRHLQRLPTRGPVLIVANHNSHLDTLVLMSLFPIRMLHKVRPVAASDYFSRNRVLSWLVACVIYPILIPRWSKKPLEKRLAPIIEAIDREEILIFFPEGTRGQAEKMQAFKPGIAFLAEQRASVPIVPVFMAGLGKALPKDDWVFVPFYCDVVIGRPKSWSGDPARFLQLLQHEVMALGQELPVVGMVQ